MWLPQSLASPLGSITWKVLAFWSSHRMMGGYLVHIVPQQPAVCNGAQGRGRLSWRGEGSIREALGPRGWAPGVQQDGDDSGINRTGGLLLILSFNHPTLGVLPLSPGRDAAVSSERRAESDPALQTPKPGPHPSAPAPSLSPWTLVSQALTSTLILGEIQTPVCHCGGASSRGSPGAWTSQGLMGA